MPIGVYPRRQRTAEEIAERFWSYVVRGNGCWIWHGALSRRSGYGSYSVNGRSEWAHRYAYELTHGPIPKGMEICHHCDVRLCVRPDHLFMGTHTDNMQDAVRKGRNRRVVCERNAAKTHCINGHEFTPENTRWSTSRGKPMRNCRACKREWARQHGGYYERRNIA